MNQFKVEHFQKDVIIVIISYYLRYNLVIKMRDKVYII